MQPCLACGQPTPSDDIDASGVCRTCRDTRGEAWDGWSDDYDAMDEGRRLAEGLAMLAEWGERDE